MLVDSPSLAVPTKISNLIKLLFQNNIILLSFFHFFLLFLFFIFFFVRKKETFINKLEPFYVFKNAFNCFLSTEYRF